MKQEVRDRLIAEKIIPVLRFESAELTSRAVDCLVDVGFGAIEITLTTPGALPLIRHLSEKNKALIGAGTVLDVNAARACIEAGAQFLVAPFVFKELVQVCHEADKPALLG